MFATHLWHPKVVHFAIALVLAALLAELLWILTKRDFFQEVAKWNLIFGGFGTIASFFSGLLAEEAVEHSAFAHEVMERHETLGYVSLVLVVILLGWRLIKGGELYRKLSWLFLVILIAASISISIGAGLGGELVFKHGVGVGGVNQNQGLPAVDDDD